MMQTYLLRGASRAALIAMLEMAQAGKPRPFVFQGEDGEPGVDPTRIRYPYAETSPGDPVIDPETGAASVPEAPTGFWLCEVRLAAPDAELAAMAEP